MTCKRRICCLLLALIMCQMTFYGCGKRDIVVPELIDAVATDELYRMAEIGNIGICDVKSGVIVPQNYEMSFDSAVEIKEIFVNVGDYVKKDQVLAKVNGEAAEYSLLDTQDALKRENQIYECNNKIYELKHKELEYKVKGANETGNDDIAAAVQKELLILEENHRYDIKMHEFNVRNISDSIEKLQKIVEDGNLYAGNDGYVSYVLDMSEGSRVQAYQNIVTISDYDEMYIELNEYTVKDLSSNTQKYIKYYSKINGKNYELEEFSYSPDELVRMEQYGSYMPVRMKFKEDVGKSVEIGNVVSIFMEPKVKQNVLVVGNDSVFGDAAGQYVYVLKDDARELRRVEIGEKDKFNTEIVSGIEEGEMVLYQTDSVPPVNYDVVEIKKEDFSSKKTNTKYVSNVYNYQGIYAELEGVMSQVSVSDKQPVNEGQLICSVTVLEGTAKLEELLSNMASNKKNYQNTVKDLDAAIEENNKLINEIKDKEDIATDTDAIEEDPYLVSELELVNEQLKVNKTIAEINCNIDNAIIKREYDRLSAGNDGNGNIIYTSPKKCIIKNIVNQGKQSKIDAGQKLFDIGVKIENILLFTEKESMHLNQKVTAELNSKQYTGTIVGIGNDNKYYVRIDDEAFFEEEGNGKLEYSVLEMKTTIVLPKDAVFFETTASTTVYGSNTYSYVWKYTESGLSKQYVDVIATTQNNKACYCILSGLSDGDKVIVKKEE